LIKKRITCFEIRRQRFKDLSLSCPLRAHNFTRIPLLCDGNHPSRYCIATLKRPIRANASPNEAKRWSDEFLGETRFAFARARVSLVTRAARQTRSARCRRNRRDSATTCGEFSPSRTSVRRVDESAPCVAAAHRGSARVCTGLQRRRAQLTARRARSSFGFETKSENDPSDRG